jgi:nitroreductase
MNISSSEKLFWETAVNSRRSVRSFERQAVDPKILESLKTFIRTVNIPFVHSVDVIFFKTPKGIPLANNLKNPPTDAVAFVTQADKLQNISAIGFIGELLILYAQGHGVSTCWFGHYILDELEKIVPEIETIKEKRPRCGYGAGLIQGTHAVCISPLGYFKSNGLRLLDRMTAATMSFKRKPLSELLINTQESAIQNAIRYALDFARKAPSAANTQHWQYEVSADNKIVKITHRKNFKHFRWEHDDVDIAICASHFWIGLLIQDIQCEINQIEKSDTITWEFKIL